MGGIDVENIGCIDYNKLLDATPTIMQSHLNVLNQEDVKESCKSLQVELKPLTASLKYVVMSPNSTYHVIINTGLYDKQIE